ncbi:response regulator [Tuwongella immobilis]|uniref:Response regulatory domain-containing protein n=1 Tax=Tuwongella immobilis TaxID=692036 RepID=A0A6C2YU43_9BACT|nr:hypothetical protein [Tuwongella immobilis]VIP04559.1 unnamed protein product [Tuwongella immobilis]VTS06479.1 unnamed protein product [Tuwongella immobilis]
MRRWNVVGAVIVASHDVREQQRWQAVLSQPGLQITVVANGLECLAAMRQHPYALMIVERDLPWGGAESVLDCLRLESRDIPEAVLVLKPRPESESAPPPQSAPASAPEFGPLPSSLWSDLERTRLRSIVTSRLRHWNL